MGFMRIETPPLPPFPTPQAQPTAMCRRATIAAALLLAALAACQLAAPAEARSMLGRKRQSQAEREAAQLAAQQVGALRGMVVRARIGSHLMRTRIGPLMRSAAACMLLSDLFPSRHPTSTLPAGCTG